MKRIIVVLLLCVATVLSCSLCGCSKEKEEECTIYGTVIDKGSQRPIMGAKIEVGFAFTIHAVTTTGSDGYYEVSFVPEEDGEFTEVSAEIQGKFGQSKSLDVSYGQRIRCDFLL